VGGNFPAVSFQVSTATLPQLENTRYRDECGGKLYLMMMMIRMMMMMMVEVNLFLMLGRVTNRMFLYTEKSV
jgi:uncharacterized protein YqhQ